MSGARRIQVGGQDGWAHDEGHATGTFQSFDRLALGEGPPRKVQLYLPRKVAAPLPTLYLFDGQTAFFGAPSLRLAERLDASAGRLVLPLVVAIHPVDRDHEYTHAPWEDGRAHGGQAAHGAWVAGALVPFLEANYPVAPQREARLVAGSSHGGLAALALAARRPELFGAAIALSPSLWVGVEYGLVSRVEGGTLRGSALLEELWPVLSDPGRRPRLWIDWGLRDDARAARRGPELAALLREAGYGEGRDLFTLADPLGGHDEAAWGHRLVLALEALLPQPGPGGSRPQAPRAGERA